jgi:hypothetical protein
MEQLNLQRLPHGSIGSFYETFSRKGPAKLTITIEQDNDLDWVMYVRFKLWVISFTFKIPLTGFLKDIKK